MNLTEKLQVFGQAPQPRFGHTITYIAKGKAILFGGATGDTGKYSITGDTYSFDQVTKYWKKVETTGSSPSPRAAHAAAAVEMNQIVIYGGATGGGSLASDDLFLLDMRGAEDTGNWTVVPVVSKTPGRRYGHTITYTKPYLVVFGGNTGQEPVNDCWFLNVEKSPFSWQKIEISKGDVPCARVYHSASLCSMGSANGMVVVYGGRSLDQVALNDIYGLRRHRSGDWDWVRAPSKIEKEQPTGRYQHSAIFMNTLMIVLGGRTNNVGEPLKLEVYDTETSEWTKFDCIQRFRHGMWLTDTCIYAYGGFELEQPNIPTDQVSRINLQKVFQKDEKLMNKIVISNKSDSRNMIREEEQKQHTPSISPSLHPTQNKDLQQMNIGNQFNNKTGLQQPNSITTQSVIQQIQPQQLPAQTNVQQQGFQNQQLLHQMSPQQLQTQQQQSQQQQQQQIQQQFQQQTLAQQSFMQQNKIQLEQQDSFNQQQGMVLIQNKQNITNPNNIHMIQNKKGQQGQQKQQVTWGDLVIVDENKNNQKDSQKKQNQDSLLIQPADQQLVHMIMIQQLLQPKNYINIPENMSFRFRSEHIIALCDMAEQIIKDQPMVLKVRAPLKIFGDIHGQYSDLMRFFDLWGSPYENGKDADIECYDYLFLGDFVDRGSHSLETICLLLAMKIRYPDQLHLIRGNHEDKWINNGFGFSEECAQRLGEDPMEEDSVFNRVNRLFEYLPLAVIIEDKIICLHGGIGSSLHYVEEIEQLQRPLEVVHEVATAEQQLVVDILWSDPTDSDAELGIQPNVIRDPAGTGNIVKFGPDRVQKFLNQNNLSLIIRAHECVMDGFERFAGGQLITVFSATDYCGRHKNAGAVLILRNNFEIIPKLIYPKDQNLSNWDDEDTLKKRPPTPPRWKTTQRKSYD